MSPAVTSFEAADVEREHLRIVGVQLERQALEVEQQVDGVFDHARDRGELVAARCRS